MMKPDEDRTSKTLLRPLLLALIVTVLAAILLAAQVAEAKPGGGGGGGGRGGGGGGGGSGKAVSSSSSKPSDASPNVSGYKGLPSGMANPASPYYNSPRYGIRHGVFSNFFLWSWLFHDRDDDEYEEEYIQSNYDSGGWIVTAIGLVALVGLPIWILRRRARG